MIHLFASPIFYLIDDITHLGNLLTKSMTYQRLQFKKMVTIIYLETFYAEVRSVDV